MMVGDVSGRLQGMAGTVAFGEVGAVTAGAVEWPQLIVRSCRPSVALSSALFLERSWKSGF